MGVHEVQERVPVGVRHAVQAGPDVMGDPAAGLKIGKPGLNQARRVVDRPCFARRFGGAERAGRVRPGVAPGAAEQDRARGDERQQRVLIDRQGVLPAGVVGVARGEPVGIAFRDRRNGFSHPVAVQGRSAGAGLMGQRDRDPRVARGGEQHRLAPP